NLSSFYLPNSQLFFGSGLLGSGMAIILGPSQSNAPNGIAGASLFRPPFCAACTSVPPVPNGFFRWGQPFVSGSAFPWTGSPGPNFGLVSVGLTFGVPGGFSSTLGPPTANGNTFGTADRWPGIGSPVGSILPGIVLATRVLPATLTSNPIVVPTSFTTA